MENNTKFWIIVASKDHVKSAINQGIAQSCHGKSTPLKRMNKGDFVIYYSSKQVLNETEKCQEFTALGKILDNEIIQLEVSKDFCPSRRNIDFLETKVVSILPLIDKLEFIQNKTKWGYPFRFGFLEINQHDFDLIKSQMTQN